MDSILVATDGSPHANEAVRAGVEIAASSGAEVVFLHVLNPLETPDDGSGDSDRQRAIAIESLLQASAHAADRGVAHRLLTIEGVPPEAIVSAAAELHVDLIVLGARRSRRRLPFASVSRAVLRWATGPVLLARPTPGRLVPGKS